MISKANLCHFKVSQNLPDLLRTNQDQEEMTRDHNCILSFVVHAFNGEQQAIEGIGKFVRLVAFHPRIKAIFGQVYIVTV